MKLYLLPGTMCNKKLWAPLLELTRELAAYPNDWALQQQSRLVLVKQN